jgi:hypothetical protein
MVISIIHFTLFFHMFFSAPESNKAYCGFDKVDISTLPLTDKFDTLAQDRGKVGQKEISGIAISQKYQGHIWGINDSGNGSVLYLYDTENANLKKLFILSDLSNTDWEDLTIGTGLSGNTHLYIADMGDNEAKRDEYAVYKIEEPKTEALDGEIAHTVTKKEVIPFMYDDGPRDAEAIAFDPVGKKLIIISKRESQVGIFELPDEPGETPHYLQQIGELPLTFVVAAEFSADGLLFMMKTYDQIFIWERQSAEEDFCDMVARTPERAPYTMIEPQGESICLNEKGFFTLSEERFGIQPRLYFYPKK